MAQRVGHRYIQMIYRTELLFLDVCILGQTFLRHIVSYIQPDSSNKFLNMSRFLRLLLFLCQTRSESGEALLAFLQRQRQPQQTRREVKSPLSKELAPSSTTWGNMTLDSIVEDSPFCNIQQGLRTP